MSRSKGKLRDRKKAQKYSRYSPIEQKCLLQSRVVYLVRQQVRC